MKVFFTLILFFLSSQSFAQQTIFNVPSADVTEKNKNFIQHESQFRSKDPQKFWNATNYYARGIGYDTEIDITQFNLSSPTSKNAAVGFGFKSSVDLAVKNFEKYKPKIVFGAMLPVSLQGNGIGHWIYSAANFYVPQTGSRITAGVSFGTKQIFGENATCFIGGFEQKISDEISFINDWYSGNNSLGIFATGFSYNTPLGFMIFAGYQIPNSKQVGRNSFVVEIARIF